MSVSRLILRCSLSLGDVVMLTAAVRELHRAHPGKYQTDVRTPAPHLWGNNPYLTTIEESEPGVRIIEMQYPLNHQSNTRRYHVLYGYVQFLETQLGVRIPLTEFK